jgi:ATP-dependent Clp protease adapter protein ClpS
MSIKEPAFVIEPWNVILLNDELHTLDEVIIQLMKATGYGLQKASDIAWEAQCNGEAICFAGQRDICSQVCSILDEIDLTFRIEKMV